MPTFAYAGRTRAGQDVSGERVADNMDAAVAALRRDQIQVTKITAAKAKEASKGTAGTAKGGSKIAAKSLAIFTRQFSVMIDAGLPLVQCLEILGTQQKNRVFQKVLFQVRQDVESGSNLAAAMRSSPKVFDALYVNMVEAGETGGILDTIL